MEGNTGKMKEIAATVAVFGLGVVAAPFVALAFPFMLSYFVWNEIDREES